MADFTFRYSLLMAGLIVVTSPTAHGETLLPKDLAADTDQALKVMLANSELDSAKYELERNRAKKGWRAFANVGYSHINDVVDIGRTRQYDAVQGRVGVSYPLLGSYEKDKRDIDVASGKVAEKTARMDVAHMMAALEMESAYADYWAAQEGLRVADRYLENENALMPNLHVREQNRLMLRSQMLAIQHDYDQARSDRARFERQKHDALNRLKRLTSRDLGEFDARLVELQAPPPVQMEVLLQKHPDLAALHAQRQALQEELGHSGWYGVDSNFEVSQAGVQDLTASQTGGATYAGLTLNAPLGIIGARRAERQRLQAEITRVQLEERLRGDELTAQVQSTEDASRQMMDGIESAGSRTKAAAEALREGALRSRTLGSQNLETISTRLHDYYTAALADIEARTKAWQANIDLRAYAYVASNEPPPTSAAVDVDEALMAPFDATRDRLGAPHGQ